MASLREVDDERDQLRSWKEIGAYFGVSARTAQKWESEHGLPVRRMPGERGRVVATRAELDAWLAGTRVEKEEERGRRWLWWAAALLVLAGLGLGMWWWWRPVAQPAAWRVSGKVLVVLDSQDRELWRQEFSSRLSKFQYGGGASGEQVSLADVDGDGEREVLFAAVGENADLGDLFCYSARGKLKWQFKVGAAAAAFPEQLRPPYLAMSLLVFRSAGQTRIAVAGVHHQEFTCQIALLDGQGRLLREYWHAGHLPELAVVDPQKTGRPYLLAGGISNSYKQGTVVVLDPEDFGGSSREEIPAYQIPGAPPREVARVLMPRSCINLSRTPYGMVRLLRVVDNAVYVASREEEDDIRASVTFHFRMSGEFAGAEIGSPMMGRHEELRRMKLLDHKLDLKAEERALSRVRWLSGSGRLFPERR